jgi:hypothetical protein
MANANVHLFGFKSTSSTRRASNSPLRTPVPAVRGYIFGYIHAGSWPWPHRRTAVTWTFSVEAKGLEPSNLLTARLVLLVRSTESECVCPGQTRCALLLHEV